KKRQDAEPEPGPSWQDVPLPSFTYNANDFRTYYVYYYYEPPAAPVDVSLEVRPSSATVSVGGTQQYEAWVKRSDGTEYRASDALWSSSDTEIATVNSTGLGSGVSPGT